MVGAYFDTGVLIKNYVAEMNSPAALALIEAEALPLPLTHFQEMEIRNSIRLKVFRREISAEIARTSLATLEEDIREGRLERPNYSITSVFARAEFLSSHHATATGARILDILHVAAAVELEATKFVSFNERQRVVAKRARLKVIP